MLGIGIGSGTPVGVVTGAGAGTPFTVYNGLTTAGQGVPPIVFAANLATQGFAVFNSATPVTLVAAGGGNAGTYRATVYLVVTTLFATNTTETITVGWTDDQGARTATIGAIALSAGSTGTLATTFRSSGSAAITYTPSVAGSPATAGAASFSVVLERLI